MKTLLLAASLFLIASCASQEVMIAPETPVVEDATPRSSDTLYRCSYKYDSKLNITFLGTKRSEYYPPTLPNLRVYHIIDINGKKWSVNEYDWENYTCIPTITLGQ